MKYYMNFNEINLKEFKGFLETSNLIPSHMVLKDQISERFSQLKKIGIMNLDSLQKALKTRQKIEALAKTAQVPEDYLVILNRAVSSLHPPARNISDYPQISLKTVNEFYGMGIQNSMQLFDSLSNDKCREELLTISHLAENEIEHAFKISALCRLRYVSPVFANLLIAASCDD